MATLQQRITQARKSRKLSQANLAERLGITRTACSHWETGRAKPSTKHIEKIAETLAVDTHWLISGKKRGDVESRLDTDKRLGSDSKTVLLETQAGYQATFDKEALKVAEEYFSLSRSQRKLVRDLLKALKTKNKNR
jgi:transcriptional regulator with XRE-family HTH domain